MTPVLLLLNGLPGSGKSTIAALLANRRPPTLALDVDEVRAMVGGSTTDPQRGGLLARRLALAMATTHLEAGFDVVVGQYLGRPEFVLRLEQTAARCRAGFVEAVLDVPVEVARDRTAERGRVGATRAHRQVDVQLREAGGVRELERMQERLTALIAARPATARIPEGPAAHVVAVLERLVEQAHDVAAATYARSP